LQLPSGTHDELLAVVECLVLVLCGCVAVLPLEAEEALRLLEWVPEWLVLGWLPERLERSLLDDASPPASPSWPMVTRDPLVQPSMQLPAQSPQLPGVPELTAESPEVRGTS
jgi:hypothetical protein